MRHDVTRGVTGGNHPRAHGEQILRGARGIHHAELAIGDVHVHLAHGPARRAVAGDERAQELDDGGHDQNVPQSSVKLSMCANAAEPPFRYVVAVVGAAQVNVAAVVSVFAASLLVRLFISTIVA